MIDGKPLIASLDADGIRFRVQTDNSRLKNLIGSRGTFGFAVRVGIYVHSDDEARALPTWEKFCGIGQ